MVYKNNRKAISPVVATALLLVVAVVAVVGFQKWYNDYSTTVFSDVEQKSSTGSTIIIERLKTDGTVYLVNKGVTDTNTITISIQGCTVIGVVTLTASTTTSAIPVGCTLVAGTPHNIEVVTAEGVFAGTLIAKS